MGKERAYIYKMKHTVNQGTLGSESKKYIRKISHIDLILIYKLLIQFQFDLLGYKSGILIV